MPDIALGRKDQGLIAFAAHVNAVDMSQWKDLGLFDDDVEGWGEAFRQTVERTLAAGGSIHFNLTGLDVGEALSGDAGVWVGRYTAWELQQVVATPQWRAVTTFYLDGVALTSVLEQLAGLPVGP